MAAVAAKVILAVLVVQLGPLMVVAAVVLELLVILVKLVKVEVEDLVQTKLSVVLVEKAQRLPPVAAQDTERN